MHLLGKYEDRVFDDREITFTVNETPTDEVVEGIQLALTHFGKNEKSRYDAKNSLFMEIEIVSSSIFHFICLSD